MLNPAIVSLKKSAEAALNGGDIKSLAQRSAELLAIDSTYADAWFFLSIVDEARGQWQKALALVDKALQLDNTNTEYITQKAKLFSLTNLREQAIACADQALALQPTNASVLDTLGVIYNRCDRQDRARRVLVRAVDLKPDNAQFHFNLAAVEKYLGNDVQAELHYEEAIKIKPTFCRAHWALSELEKNKASTKRLQRLQGLASDKNLPDIDKLYIAHAISREYEKQDEYDTAFQTLLNAKENRRRSLGYNIDTDKQLFAQINSVFSTNSFTEIDSDLGEDTIFVLGMPRSGTTLVERIVASHSQVRSLGELPDFQRTVKLISQSKTKPLLDMDTLSKAYSKSPRVIGEQYLKTIQGRKGTEQYYIDKMPLNFLYIGFIAQALPKAKIICLCRNPLDTIVSNFRQLFAVNFSYYNYHYSIEDTARYYVLFNQLMTYWRSLLGERLYFAEYESLVNNPEAEVKAMFSYLAIPFEVECLNFHNSRAPVTTASASQVRQPIYNTSIARWKRYENYLTEVKSILNAAGIKYNEI